MLKVGVLEKPVATRRAVVKLRFLEPTTDCVAGATETTAGPTAVTVIWTVAEATCEPDVAAIVYEVAA